MSASFSNAAIKYDQLIAGNAMLLTSWPITLDAGQNLLRGAVLGKITATGNYTLSLEASVDGSQVPDLILVEDTDATAGDTQTIAYARGDFNENELTIGTGHTADSIREGLRQKGIMVIRPAVDAV